MINLYKEVDKKLYIQNDTSEQELEMDRNCWYSVIEPTPDEMKKLKKIVSIDPDILFSIMDEEESAHLDIDDDYTLIVLDVPVYTDGYYETYPFSIIYNDNFYMTFCKKKIDLFSIMKRKFKKIEPHKHVRLTLQIMYAIASSYISSLKIIDSKRNDIEKGLQLTMKNDELLALMDLNKSLVYFSTSLNANKVVISKTKRLSEYKRYEDDFDLIEDVEVENNQAVEMCTIYRDILAGMMDAFASIISNNLNIVMKALAVITLIISIPTLVASLFGMNVLVPFSKNDLGFYIIIGISLILSLVSGAFLFVFTSKKSYIKRRNKKK